MVIAVLFNLKPAAEDQTVQEEEEPPDSYTEWDDLETILAVQNALRSEGEVVLIEANEDCFDRLRRIRPDIVFNIAEGRRGAQPREPCPLDAGVSRHPLYRFFTLNPVPVLRQSKVQRIPPLSRHSYTKVRFSR